MIENIEWLGHSSFRITGQRIVYIDPYEITASAKQADIVLITHSHIDHFSVDDILKVSDRHTTILAPADCNIQGRDVVHVKPGEVYTAKGLRIETVPAYNTHKSYHPKSKGWVGYIVEINDMRIYHAGDTDLIPEMTSLKNIDVALLPIGGTYTMNADDAAHATDMIQPEIAIPMHYGSIVGTSGDAEKFKGLCHCQVEFLH